MFQAPLITCPVCSWPTKMPLGQSPQQHHLLADTSCHLRIDEINRAVPALQTNPGQNCQISVEERGCLSVYWHILQYWKGGGGVSFGSSPHHGNSIPEKHSRVKLKGQDFSRFGQQ